MEITNEIKAKVFAQYLGQPAIFHQLADERSDFQYPPQKSIIGVSAVDYHTHDPSIPYKGNNPSEWKVILKPLSAITDEDAIEVVNIIIPETKTRNIKMLHGVLTFDEKLKYSYRERSYNLNEVKFSFELGQFLQSRGYDLPQYLLNGQTLKEAGLAIYQ